MTAGMKKEPGLFKGVMLAYFILILHVLLIAALGMLVIFFRGIVIYMPWIFLIGCVTILGSGYFFYRRIKAQGKSLRETLNSPLLQGKSFEISLMGGLASFKVGQNDVNPPIFISTTDNKPQLEDPAAARLRELSELANLLEKDLITPDEYNRVKRKLFKI